jgi:hypothetical protein
MAARPAEVARPGAAWLRPLRTPLGVALLVALAGGGVWLALQRAMASRELPAETYVDLIVVDEDGRPLPGAVAALFGADPAETVPRATARANERGVAHLLQVDGLGPWRLEVSPPRPWDPDSDPRAAIAPEMLMKRAFAPRTDGKLTPGWYPRRIDEWVPAPGQIVLRRWVMAVVRVVEEEPKDQAIPGVPVRWRVPGQEGDANVVLGRTDAEGRCRFPLPIDKLTVAAWITDPQLDGTDAAEVTTALPAADLVLKRRAPR